MKPEDIDTRPASFDPAHPWLPAHEVGTIIKAAMEDAQSANELLYETWHSDGVRAKRLETLSAWLAKADELEGMK